MTYLQTFTLALGITSLGFSTPGMLNLTVLRRSLRYDRRDATWFATGIATVTLIQAYLAITFVHYLSRHEAIFDYLTYAGIIAFLGLAGYFLYQARHPTAAVEKKEKRTPYWAGLGLAAMNMLSLPFFVGYGLLLKKWGWLEVEQPHNYFFAGGATLGAFLFLMLYARFARYIDDHFQFIARNINYILSGLFLLMTGVAVYRALGG